MCSLFGCILVILLVWLALVSESPHGTESAEQRQQELQPESRYCHERKNGRAATSLHLWEVDLCKDLRELPRSFFIAMLILGLRAARPCGRDRSRVFRKGGFQWGSVRPEVCLCSFAQCLPVRPGHGAVMLVSPS